MTATLTRRSPKTNTVWLWIVLAAALGIGLAAIGGLQREAQAGIPGPHPPKAVLMKGSQQLQVGRLGSYCWVGSGVVQCVDSSPGYPARDLVMAGSRLHIKIFKAQRPDRFSIYADSRRLDTTLRRVERDGKTVAWNVFFHVNQLNRHYYLHAYGTWSGPSADQSGSGGAVWHFHVKTSSWILE